MLESLLAIDWCLARDVRFVMMADSTKADAPRTAAKEAIKRRIVGQAAAALVGGSPHAAYVEELGVPASRIFLGYDVVDNAYFAAGASAARRNEASRRSELDLPECYFLCCARLIEKKNISGLIKAFSLYRKQADGPLWDLVIAGPGPLQAEIEALIAAHSLIGAVHLVGAKDYQELPDYYGLAGALILPSSVDQWGLVVNEAMAAGLPVLVSIAAAALATLLRRGVMVSPSILLTSLLWRPLWGAPRRTNVIAQRWAPPAEPLSPIGDLNALLPVSKQQLGLRLPHQDGMCPRLLDFWCAR